LLVLAAALGIPPILLIYPAIPDGLVEALPGWDVASSEAMHWFYGDGVLPQRPGLSLDVDYDARSLLDAVKEKQRLEWTRFGLVVATGPNDSEGQAANSRIVEQVDSRLVQVTARIHELGGVLNEG
jgi:hypothetical protein